MMHDTKSNLVSHCQSNALLFIAHACVYSLIFTRNYDITNIKDISILVYRSIFARFITMWEKQILARAIGTQKENWGNRAFLFLR